MTSTVPTTPHLPGLEVSAVEHRSTPSRGAALSLRRRATALLDLLAAPIVFVFAFFGVEYDEAAVFFVCDYCRQVHADQDECDRMLVGQCTECVAIVTLDPAGNCSEGRYHSISNRRPRGFIAAAARRDMEGTPMRK